MLQLSSHVSSLAYIQKNLHHGQHLVQLLQLFRELEATDPRDKLWAFWGLANGDLPEPDYKGTTARSAFISTAKWVLQNTKGLLLLAMGLRPDPELPSWVPNFAQTTPFEPNFWRRRLHCLEMYDSSKGIEYSVQFIYPETLCLKGIPIDEVADVSRQTLISDDIVLHTELLREWQSFACSSSMSDAFCETLIAGCSHQISNGTLRFPAATARDISLCKEFIERTITHGDVDNDTDR